MKFATILRESGFSVECFEKCAEISINLYDGKDRVDTNEDAHFAETLFANNNSSFIDLLDYLKDLEKNPPESMNVKIDEFSVIFFYKTPLAKVFSRKPKPDPLVFAD